MEQNKILMVGTEGSNLNKWQKSKLKDANIDDNTISYSKLKN